MKISKFYKKYKKDNSDSVFSGYPMFSKYEAIDLTEEEIYYRKHKLINKVIKRIAKQIQKKPLQNWYLIDINDYSLKEMRYIKTFFENQDFKITFTEPKDNMYESNNCYTISMAVSVSSNLHTKFYICWNK